MVVYNKNIKMGDEIISSGIAIWGNGITWTEIAPLESLRLHKKDLKPLLKPQRADAP